MDVDVAEDVIRGRGRPRKRSLTAYQRMLQLYRDGWEKGDARERMNQERYSSSSLSKCFGHWPGGKPLSNSSDSPVAVLASTGDVIVESFSEIYERGSLFVGCESASSVVTRTNVRRSSRIRDRSCSQRARAW